MATKAEIAVMAARKLGILGIGQTLSSEYTSILNEAYDAVFYALRDDGLNTWAYSAEVPIHIEDYFATMVANRRGLEVGASQERIAIVAAGAQLAEREIRKHLTTKYVSIVNAVDY